MSKKQKLFVVDEVPFARDLATSAKLKVWLRLVTSIRNSLKDVGRDVLYNNMPMPQVNDYIVEVFFTPHPSNIMTIGPHHTIRQMRQGRVYKFISLEGLYFDTNVGMLMGDEALRYGHKHRYRITLPLSWLQQDIEKTEAAIDAALTAEKQRKRDTKDKYLDTGLQWERLREEFGVSKKINYQKLRRLVPKRFRLSGNQVNRDFGLICAYIVLRELENEGELSVDGLCQKFADALNTDVLSLVEEPK